VLVAVCLAAGCDKKDSNGQASADQVVDRTTLLATITDEGRAQSIDPSLSMGLHTSQSPSFEPIFSKNGGGVAYRDENDEQVYVVHNGNAGKRYDAVGAIALSPDGRRIAYGALVGGKWHMIIDGKVGTAFSTVKSPLFSPDGNHLAYQAMSGEKWYLVVDTTLSHGTDTRFLDHRFSADSQKIAYIDNADDFNKRGRLVISDLTFARQTVISPVVSKMLLNQEGSRLAAVIASVGKEQMVSCGVDRPEAAKYGPLFASIQHPVFGPDGVVLAYSGERDGKRMLVLDGREETIPDGGSLVEAPVVQPDAKGVGALIFSRNQVFFHQFFIDGVKREGVYDQASGLTYNREGSVHAYTARRGNTWFVVVNGEDGAGFDRVITPKFSPNGKYLVYRARKDGKRFVVVAKTNGKIIRQHPSYEQVFDTAFSADGKSVAYGVKDGHKLVWRVELL
jgi:hypothetical protein